jgi:hypothetical protein
MINLMQEFYPMKILNLRTFFIVTSLIFASTGMAIPADKPQLEQLSWLAGCWTGAGLGGEIDECWMQSPDGTFTGVYQLVKDGEQQFSEIEMIAEFDGKLGMRVKHFDASFEQWESDKGVGPTFPFVELGENYIQFEGLRYELINGACHVTLDMKKDDTTHQVSFVFTRN